MAFPVSKGVTPIEMAHGTQFRRILPIAQTLIAAVFGGWGLWLRNSVLSHPFLGDSTLWDSTARFHVWPWQLRFAAILNMPALLAGGLLSLPISIFRPGTPEIVSVLPPLLAVFLLWYWVGSWLDRGRSIDTIGGSNRSGWILVVVFTAVCAGAASFPYRVGHLANYQMFGSVIWLLAAIGMRSSRPREKTKATTSLK